MRLHVPDSCPGRRRTAARAAAVVLALALAFPLAAAPARCATLPVAPSDALAAIQSALNRAQHGDTVLVEPGDYNERVKLPSGVTLRSSQGADVTRILADTRGSVVTSVGGDSLTRLEGFTVSRGRGSKLAGLRWEAGGGLLAWHSAIRVRNNIFINNKLEQGRAIGGGAALFECMAVLEGNRFEANRGNMGGGLYARACSLLVVRGNEFINNLSPLDGGGCSWTSGARGSSSETSSGRTRAAGAAAWSWGGWCRWKSAATRWLRTTPASGVAASS